MTLYPETKVVRVGEWFRVYVLTHKGWTWNVQAKSKREAQRIAKACMRNTP